MATYDELLLASENAALKNKIRVAVFIAAQTIYTESTGTTNHTERLAWAKQVFSDSEPWMERMMRAVLAQNKNATLSAITSASDATVQTAVDAAVNVFI